MTNRECEEEICQLLNAAPLGKHKEVQNDIVYILCVKDGDMEKALERAYAIAYGDAQNITQMRRVLKQRRRKNRS